MRRPPRCRGSTTTAIASWSAARARARVVLFSSPTCSICREVAPGIGAAASAAGLTPMVLHDPDLERVYDVPGTPFAAGHGRARDVVRAKGTVNNLEQVEGLIDLALRRIEEVPERRAS